MTAAAKIKKIYFWRMAKKSINRIKITDHLMENAMLKPAVPCVAVIQYKFFLQMEENVHWNQCIISGI